MKSESPVPHGAGLFCFKIRVSVLWGGLFQARAISLQNALARIPCAPYKRASANEIRLACNEIT